MPRPIHAILAATACLLAANAAHAVDYVYGYGTVALTPQGQLTGSFRTTDAYVGDGIVTAEELTADFTFSNASAPFAPAQFAPAEFAERIITTGDTGEIYVDRVSGEPYAGLIYWRATDTSTGQVLTLGPNFVRVDSDASATQSTQAQTPLTVSGGGSGAISGGPGGGPGNDITYTYRTTTPAQQANAVQGSFVVNRAAIVDGLLTFDEVLSADFTMPDATAPFAPTTFTRADFVPRFATPRDTGAIRVDPVTGVFQHDFMLSANYPGTSNKALDLFPHRYAVWRPSGLPSSVRGFGNFTASGGGGVNGSAPPVATPALHPLAILALAGLLALLAARGLRSARH